MSYKKTLETKEKKRRIMNVFARFLWKFARIYSTIGKETLEGSLRGGTGNET